MSAGLLWCDFMQNAFERWDICFSFGDEPNTLKLHVINKNLLNWKLAKLVQNKDKAYIDMLGDRRFR